MARLRVVASVVWSDILRAAPRERHLAVTMVSSLAELMAAYSEPRRAEQSDGTSVAHLVVSKALLTAEHWVHRLAVHSAHHWAGGWALVRGRAAPTAARSDETEAVARAVCLAASLAVPREHCWADNSASMRAALSVPSWAGHSGMHLAERWASLRAVR